MSTGICYLVGAGTHFYNNIFTPGSDDLVIAVDGGYDYLNSIGVIPDLLIGDFDSINGSKNIITGNDIPVISFPPEKDYTDMYLAAEEGMKRGYNIFYIYGGTGGRIDHTVSNIQLITWISTCKVNGRNAIAYLYDEKQLLTAITDTEFSLSTTCTDSYHAYYKARTCGYVSVFSHSNISENVTINGLRYNVNNITLTNNMVLGTSNEFTGSDCTISVEKGTLIISLER